MLHARQMKAARALLDWSQKDLAKASKLSPCTIKNIESGEMSPRGVTTQLIKRIFEESGIEFTEGKGVRLRDEKPVEIYQGTHGFEAFYEDMLHLVKEKTIEIFCVFKSTDAFIDACSLKSGKLGPLSQISKHAKIKCILPEALNEAIPSAPCEMRTIAKQRIGPTSYFAFANKYVVVFNDGSFNSKFVVFNSSDLADGYKQYFYELWSASSHLTDVIE